jgi:multidrug transporter EmrE-like cation transporter
MKVLLSLIVAQILFTIGDLIARANMRKSPFAIETFLTMWFLIYFVIRTIATFFQLYVFATVPLGKTMALFGAVSIVLSNLLAFLFLKEVLSIANYIGISFAVLAFVVLAVAK